MSEDVHIQHLNNVIDHLKTQRAAVVRGYEQAVEELGREGDYHDKNWLEAYEYLSRRLTYFKSGGML